ncbi:MAG: TlpA disulfide reductase family protein [Candidatus Paracaedibacteraceae bacterium]|nr:TlpA disulfide reductase family protein [Candidatus Paracaedibacteraceae bacterium]
MNKNFIYGICAAFIVVSAYSTSKTLLNKSVTVEQEEVPLSLIDINFVRDSNPKSMPDYKITKHGEKGEEFKLGDLKGKSVVVHFWATWCQPCQKELPFYDKFIASRPEIVHVALTPDGTKKDKIKAFFAQNGLKNIPVMTDEAGIISKYFETKAFPTTLFISKEGVLVGRIMGIVDWQDPKTVELLVKTFAE